MDFLSQSIFELIQYTTPYPISDYPPVFWLDYEYSPFSLKDSSCKASETRNAFLAWDDFHARSPFARSTIPEDKRGLLVVYFWCKLGTVPNKGAHNVTT